jgi:uncharacterized protein
VEEQIYSLLKDRKIPEIIDWCGRDSSVLNFRDRNGVSLLMLSYYFKAPELSDFILSHREPTDIFEAVSAGEMNLAERYLNSDPTLLEAFSTDGFTPLGFASYFGRYDLVKMLLERGANPARPSRNAFAVAPIHSAVAVNSEGIARLLLEHKADPNARQQQGITPLHSAAHNGNAGIVKLLLAFGADRNLRSADGKTALDMAREAGASDVIMLIEDQNSNV